MGQILIRKVDDAALERLQRHAKEQGLALEAFARAALEEYAQRRTTEETQEWLASLADLRNMTPRSNLNSVSILRQLRDGDETDR